jgi:hypothetical protein
MPNDTTPAPGSGAKATGPAMPAPARPVSAWQAQKKIPLHWYRAACTAKRWADPADVDVTEADYDAAVKAAQTARHG